MKKLSLDLNALAVESFDTTTLGAGARGTVRGNADTVPAAGEEAILSCCPSQCASACPTQCATCGGPSCEATCKTCLTCTGVTDPCICDPIQPLVIGNALVADTVNAAE